MPPFRYPRPRIHFHDAVQGGVAELQLELLYGLPEGGGNGASGQFPSALFSAAGFSSVEEVILGRGGTELEEFHGQGLDGTGGRGQRHPGSQDECDVLAVCRGLSENRLQGPRTSAL